MSVSVRRPVAPVLAMATDTLIQLAVAVERIYAHETSRDPVRARAAVRCETTLIAVLARLLTTNAKCRMG